MNLFDIKTLEVNHAQMLTKQHSCESSHTQIKINFPRESEASGLM